MEERFPRALLLVVGAATLVVLIIGAVGLWEQGGPALLPEDHMDRLKNPGEGPDEPAPKKVKLDPAHDPPPATNPTSRRPSVVRVVAIWEALEAASPGHGASTSKAASFGRAVPRPSLPEVQGRVWIATDRGDGGVTAAEVIHGAPLRLTVRRAGPGEPGADSILEYAGRGRHARIIGLITASGARVVRFLAPRGVGAPEARWTLTAPGRMAGIVVDASTDRPVAGATVRVGPSVVSTDSAGRFGLESIRGREVVAYVTAPRFVPHRAVLETPDGFATASGPSFRPRIRLQPGVQLTVDVRLPRSVKPPATGYRFYLIPFAHRLAMRDLAVEELGPLVAAPGGRLIVPGYPKGLEMCLVGVHPEMDLIYRRLRGATTDLVIPEKGRRRLVMQGAVRGKDGQPLRDVRMETTLDGVTVGDVLGAARMIPTGLEPGNFPLPSLDQPLITKSLDPEGNYWLAYDSGQRRALALRFEASGLAPRIVAADRLADRQDIDLAPRARPVEQTAQIALKVVLMGYPRIERFECRGLEADPDTVTRPGRIEAIIPRVPLGHYRFRIEADGYRTYSRTLDISVASKRGFDVFLSYE